ncbi:unnamed protein product [Heligmosomoides polygyrus]|uniref:GON-4-like protein n=1 Tax=Heligmosomoides polygyrus TaxID=6339 RepID=A0A183G8C8_HELPZ|nr:unnamed protein product [Heligmosomoides polygyrus]
MKLAERTAIILQDFELRQLEIDEVEKLEVVEEEDQEFQPEEDCEGVTTPLTSEGTTGMGPVHLPEALSLGSFGCPMGQVGVPRVYGTAAALGPPTCDNDHPSVIRTFERKSGS